jgi:hypothetical protein
METILCNVCENVKSATEFRPGRKKCKRLLPIQYLPRHGAMMLPLIDRIHENRQKPIIKTTQQLRLVPIEKFTSADTKFVYHTFFCSVESEFVPVLNDEHIGWAWISAGNWPKPMHPGLWSTVNFEAVRDKAVAMERSYMSA